MGTGRRLAIMMAAAALVLWQGMPAAWASGRDQGGEKQHQQEHKEKQEAQHGENEAEDHHEHAGDSRDEQHKGQDEEHHGHKGEPSTCAPVNAPSPTDPAAGTPSPANPAPDGNDDCQSDDRNQPGTTPAPVTDPTAPPVADPAAPPTTDPDVGATAAVGARTKAERIAKVKTDSRDHAKEERRKGENGAYLVYVDGQRVNVSPLARSGRTLVPFRRLAESLGAEVSWEPSTRTVTMVKGDQTVTISIGAATATINGQTVTIEVPPELVEGSTFVPLRFIAAALGADVDYDPVTGAITVITTPVTPAPADPVTPAPVDPAAPAPADPATPAAPADPAAPTTP